MFVKRFQARTLEEALARVKKEMGPEALILSSQAKKTAWYRPSLVEVMAAKSVPPKEVKPEPVDDGVQATLEKVFPHRKRQTERSGYGDAEEEAELVKAVSLPTPVENAAPVRHGRWGRYLDFGAQVEVPKESAADDQVGWFVERGFSDASAKEIVRRVVFDYPREDRQDPKMLAKIRARVVSSGLQLLDASVFDARTVWSAVGVGGVGKTTLLVKMAVALKKGGYDVSLVSCDRKKVVGQRELATYARLISARYESEPKIERGPKRVQLIDSPSLSPAEPKSLDEVREVCRGTSPVLVLDATTRLKEALRLIEFVAPLQPAAIAFTRLDLVTQPGVLFEVLKAAKLPLLGASPGDGFREPFRTFEGRAFADWVLGAGEVAP